MLFTGIILHRILQFLHQQPGEIRAAERTEHVPRWAARQGQSRERTITAEEDKKFWPGRTDQEGGGGEEIVLQHLQQLSHAKNWPAKHWTAGRPNHNYQFDTI